MNNVPQNIHARSNSVVLFNICAAMIVHAVDFFRDEGSNLKESMSACIWGMRELPTKLLFQLTHGVPSRWTEDIYTIYWTVMS